MNAFDTKQLQLAEAIETLAYANPFTPQRAAAERAILAGRFDPAGTLVHMDADREHESPNVLAIDALAQPLARAVRDRLAKGASLSDREADLYELLVIYVLYYRYHEPLRRAAATPLDREDAAPDKPLRLEVYRDFRDDLAAMVKVCERTRPILDQAPHLFASLFQVRRAFAHIFHHIVGRSAPIARLRAAVWQSIFTHDLRRYRRMLYDRMAEFTTLITGPSGTGKELVARAIGLSRYVPFDAKALSFAGDPVDAFFPVNLSALSPTLIESELFGHRRGAFTGALDDHAGWFETCPPHGAVFLDEIGDLEGSIQVKLLRVLQSHIYVRVGATRARRFDGKIIAATNRDLAAHMRDGQFREDLYYRLCSDLIETPSLAEQLAAGDGDELRTLVMHIARRLVHHDAEALADDVAQTIAANMPPNYPWPGNVRELEQCVRNVLIRRDYHPPAPPAQAVPADAREALARDIAAGNLDMEQLLSRYCTLIYADTGSYEQAARRLGIDRRTVKAKVDQDLLAELRSTGDH